MHLPRALLVALAVLAGAATHPTLAQQPAFQPGAETPEVWPAGPGREETFYQCTACHATGLITRIGMTRAQWNDIIDQMVAKNAMPEPEAADRKVYLDYLSAAFPPRAPQQGGGNWRNPFQPQR
ncbi:hypothetical protein E8L99_04625 [Phreatobacter aquaticus]|uniref:Cytochrome c n=1 Tax=Phreatobacter aquaticus TaxID=2570229 RepID=A0A4D7QEV0_9HYPH|nr:hypothetical protein [Phreatobacter aquaticus]QCK85111.1 hypothetical protein E8L99_04625 [Phreatobacter aquaticus]